MYASFMQKVAKGYGIESEIFRESEDITEEELGSLITDLSHDREITGILMMMPLPKGISEEKMISLIDPDKDVDGLTDTNSGRLFAGKEGLFGCTPRAVMAILDHYRWKEGCSHRAEQRHRQTGVPDAPEEECHRHHLPFPYKGCGTHHKGR